MVEVVRKNVEWEVNGQRFAIQLATRKIELITPDGQSVQLEPHEWKTVLKEMKATLSSLPLSTVPPPDKPRPPNSHSAWTPEFDKRLRERWKTRAGIAELAGEFGRSDLAIQARLAKLGLLTF